MPSIHIRLILLITLLSPTTSVLAENSLAQWLSGNHRSEDNVARNQYRHPIETLQFFELQPDSRVLEVWPGAGWYTEILAPYLREKGYLVAAHFSPAQNNEYLQNLRKSFLEKLLTNPTLYDKVVVANLFPPGGDDSPAPAGSLDRIFTFRNVHNWSKGGFDQAMFNSFFRMLKTGGILGVVEHRAKPGTNFDTMIQSGYMTEEYVTNLAIKAGFRLLDRSEVNANPKDTTKHPNGVWSLPPTLRGAENQLTKFQAIGESDRMTLKFIKPEQ